MAKAVALKILLTVLAASLLCSCQKSDRQNRSETPIVTSYKLIDDNREDEAIVLLDLELARVPPDSAYAVSLKVAQASAYAHKAGFKIQKFATLFRVSKNGVDFGGKPTVSQKESSKSEAVDTMIRTVGTLLASFRTVMDYYTAIPSVKPEDEKYLGYALRIMTDLGDKLTPGQTVYRAVLNVVYLKSYLAEHIFNEQGERKPIDLEEIKACEIDFNKMNKSLERTAKITISILDDLSKAQPSKAENYSKLRKQIGNSFSDLTVFATSASLVDETALYFTKQAFVEAGLRNLLQCHSNGIPRSAASRLF